MAELDHIIIAGPNLEALVREFHDATGIRPVRGGKHDGLGTANALIGLGNRRYIELIGPDPDQPEPAGPRPLRVDEVVGSTVVGWALRVDDIDTQVATARSLGYDPGDVVDMTRTTPDGETLNWRMTSSAGGYHGTAPFLIEWAEGGAHPSEGLPEVKLLRFGVMHPRMAAVRRALHALGALEAVADVSLDDDPRVRMFLGTPNGTLAFG